MGNLTSLHNINSHFLRGDDVAWKIRIPSTSTSFKNLNKVWLHFSRFCIQPFLETDKEKRRNTCISYLARIRPGTSFKNWNKVWIHFWNFRDFASSLHVLAFQNQAPKIWISVTSSYFWNLSKVWIHFWKFCGFASNQFQKQTRRKYTTVYILASQNQELFSEYDAKCEFTFERYISWFCDRLDIF